MCQSSPWSSAVAPEETPPYATSRSPSLPKKEKSSAEWSYRAESRHICTYLRGVTIADPSVPEVNHRMARMTTRDRSEVGGQTLSPAEADSWADRRPEPQARGAARTREEGAGMTTGALKGAARVWAEQANRREGNRPPGARRDLHWGGVRGRPMEGRRGPGQSQGVTRRPLVGTGLSCRAEWLHAGRAQQTGPQCGPAPDNPSSFCQAFHKHFAAAHTRLESSAKYSGLS